MRTRMQVKGLVELKKNLEKVGRNVTDVMDDAIMAGAAVIEKAAKAKAPVKFGRLRRSITAEIKSKSYTFVTVRVGPGKEGFYGRFVELGTKKMPAKPFLRPAFDENVQEARKEIRKVIKEAVKRGL